MASRVFLLLLIVILVVSFIVTGVFSTTFTFTNNCGYTVWPGLLASAGSPPLETTGFVLQKGESRVISAPPSWSGRFWGRTLCSEDSTGKFSCVTADCGSVKIECAGGGAAPPATLAEFTLNGAGGFDFYDVSLVDGYNLQMLVVPQGGSGGGGGGNCNTTGCLVDLNGMCPSELKVLSSVDGNNADVACKSACEAFRKDEYCCSGEFGNPNTCKPSSYSEIFKRACPRAYSYAYDDGTSTFTCASADYLIAYCPPSSANSQKSSHYPEAAMYFMGNQQGDASVASSTRVEHGGGFGGGVLLLAVALSVSAAIWRL
ncbi:Thaumatin [Macleaya cordata]|uniref:Thaumatin n=1 Tax=Macleaya cordata TaxID=56857 RepID=A0A200RAV9_MACCD|nr:Thaumatin [Macleaya cordata]